MKLIIAEKRSVGEAIAAAIGVKEKKDGYMEGLNAIISWCLGHLVEMAQPEAYDARFQVWRWDDLPILPGEWKYTVRKHAEKQYHILNTLMNREDVDSIVCATDAGREGELIFRLVYLRTGCRKPVQRLWISSMSEDAIRQGFQRMRPAQDYDRLYDAALCRQKADWLIGINATRIYTTLFNVTLTIGRVMTPTLALVVEREEAITHFVPEPFYTVDLRCGFIASSPRVKSKEEAERIAAMCQYKTAFVKKIEKKKHTEKPPTLYDLTALQRDANRLFGYTAQQTLDYTQSLYESRLVTYPRTDSRFLTGDMEEKLPALVQAVSGAFLFTSGVNHPVHSAHVIDDDKVSDHHAIIPTLDIARFDLQALPAGQQNILQLIAVRLLAAVGADHEYEESIVTVACEGTDFTARQKKVTKMGWKIPEALFQGSLAAQGALEKEEISLRMPELTEGQELKPVMAAVKEGKTTPPAHFTEGTLLAAMEAAGAADMPEDAERKGLGTPATRAGIIESLIDAEQLERKGGRKVKFLTPTELGRGLISVVSDKLKSPDLTVEWEQRLKAIEEGRDTPDAFLEDVIALLTELRVTVEFKPGMENPFKNNFDVIGSCPHCGGRVLEKTRLKAWECENPQCGFVIWQDNKYFKKFGAAMTRDIAVKLLRDRQVAMQNLRSPRTGGVFDGVITLDTEKDGKAKYSLLFPNNGKR